MDLNKRVNRLWTAFAILNVVIIVLSLFGCIGCNVTSSLPESAFQVATDFIPGTAKNVSYGSVAVNVRPVAAERERQVYTGLSPDPKPLFGITVSGAVVTVMFLFKAKAPYIIGNVLAFIEMLLSLISVPALNLIASVGLLYGSPRYEYYFTPVGVIVCMLTVISFAFSVIMTVKYLKKRQKAAGAAEVPETDTYSIS